MEKRNNVELLNRIFGPVACRDIDESLNDNEELILLTEEVLASLEPAWKIAIELSCYGGKTIEEISKIMDASSAEVEQFIALGLRKLKHPSNSKKLRKFISE